MKRAGAKKDRAEGQEDQTSATYIYDGRHLRNSNGVPTKSLVTNIRVLPGVTSIGERAFRGCSSLSSITLPEGITDIGWSAFSGCTLLEQRSVAAGHLSVESYLRFISRRANRRYAVLTSLARLTRELYARRAKRARRQAGEDAAAAAAEEVEEVVVVEEQAGGLRGKSAFYAITLGDVWRYMYAVLASLARLGLAEEQVVVVEEQAGGLLRGDLAFDAITSEAVWRYILEFV